MANELNSMDIQQVLECLPHRYPFLMIDKVVDYEPGKWLHAVKNVTVNEPIFTGHFPEKPVFPGVMMIEALAQATGILVVKSDESGGSAKQVFYLVSVDNAKFKRPVGPGDTVHLHVEFLRARRGMGKFNCVAKVNDQIVCSAEIMCAKAG